jgi:hypothetical protein
MTQRKPPNVSIPSWIEHQIRSAQADGAFENLPGHGQPLANLDAPRDDMTWIASWLHRQEADMTAVLPPALALAKEVEELPARLLKERSPAQVRSIIDELNERIRMAHRRPQDGPPMRVWIVDVERAMHRWEAGRQELAAQRPAPPPLPEPTPPPRRWWQRRSS